MFYRHLLRGSLYPSFVGTNLLRLALAAALSVTLSSCGTAPTKTEQAQASQKAPSISAVKLLKMAAQATSPERESLVLQAAQAYLDTGKLSRARSLLGTMDADYLPDHAFIKHTDLLSTIALKDEANFLAYSLLTKPRLDGLWQQMEPATEISLREKRALVFSLLGEAERGVSERINLSSLITQEKLDNTNQAALWQDLMSLPVSKLETLAEEQPTDTARGWYSLAALAKNNQSDLEHQQNQLQDWMYRWPQHPAHDNLPSDLRLLQSLIAKQPRKIALLLPMEGKLAEAGEAVRDGFFSAYYQSMKKGRNLPEVRQYDSSEDTLNAYNQAVTDGADLIIGPLDKEKVSELSLLPSLPVPLLSLNYADSPPPKPLKGFYQFGLAVEDEARQVARQGYLEGHRQAMIIIPNQEWSQRSARAFSEEWEHLGGTVVALKEFKPNTNYSSLIKEAMLIEPSLQRSRELQDFLGIKLETSPHRRADVDMIFLIANPAQARQIKPTFAFHYAGNIPVYATSQIYSGEPNATADRDLNGIRFNGMPWIFESNPEKEAIAQYTKSAAVYGRLHALGADAFRLYARLPQLAQVPQMRIYGATGSLKMQADGRIEREQTWARFRNGLAQALPTVINQSDLDQ